MFRLVHMILCVIILILIVLFFGDRNFGDFLLSQGNFRFALKAFQLIG